MLTTSAFRARVQAFRNRQRGFVAMAAAGDVTDPAAMTSSSSAGAMAELIGTLAVLGAVILTTVVGNALVIAAVVLERNLRSHVANYLVAVNEGIYGPWLSDRAPVWVWGTRDRAPVRSGGRETESRCGSGGVKPRRQLPGGVAGSRRLARRSAGHAACRRQRGRLTSHSIQYNTC